MSHEPSSTVTSIFPDLSPEELKEAEETLRRYLDFILRLYNRLASEEDALLGVLTGDRDLPRIEAGRTFTNQYTGTGS